MIVVTYETDKKEYSEGMLKYSCEKNGIELVVLGQGVEWNGTKDKIYGYLNYVSQLSDDEVVVCCDNRDVILTCKPEELVELFKKMGGGCYYSAELGGFPIWALEKHFLYPNQDSKYRKQVRVLNSGVCVGYAGRLKKVFEHAIKYYDMDKREHLMDRWGLTEAETVNTAYPDRLGSSPLDCDQLAIQLTYLETDLIELDYDYELIYTSFVLPASWNPTLVWRKENQWEYPVGSMFDIKFNWNTSYRAVHNEYEEYQSFPMIYHAPGSDYSMSQVSKVLKGKVPNVNEPVISEDSYLQMKQFISESNRNRFVCWKTKPIRCLSGIAKACVESDKILVVLLPKLKEYSDDLNYMISNYPDNIRVYECTRRGMRGVFRSIIKGYTNTYTDSVAIPEEQLLCPEHQKRWDEWKQKQAEKVAYLEATQDVEKITLTNEEKCGII